MNRFLHTAALAFMASSALSACTPLMLGGGAATANYILNKDVVNLKERNYAAADYMVQQIHTYIGRSDIIKAVPLHDSFEPALTSAVGEIIPHQVGTRLSELGYSVDLSDVTRQGDGYYLAPEIKSGQKARYVLSGTYTRHQPELMKISKDLTVNLRINDLKTGRTLSTFAYTVEMSGEVDEISAPKPVIMRTTDK